MTEAVTVERLHGGLSLHTTRAMNRLADGKPGDLITRDEMAGIIGRDCNPGDKGYGNVGSAIRACIRERGVVWQWSRPDQAWKCLNPAECVGETTRGISGGFRKVNRALRVAATVNPEGLDNDTRREHSLNIAIAGAMRVMGHGGTRKKLEAKVETIAEPDVGKVLRLMQK
jgi:hypothetical protein